ncbi:pleckstrin homology domain-containing family B member 1 isoform X3 [Tachyglossus aculeatus]|uniref:pleckstrin homology domain-containing family B member 1 isoform X3 n=1 Tax=Tachyglossus aculeatus TaxID=9261 RepID=UPI0018F46E42|nr:pleckstrin homology domain-containing family B member 1 isoform X3 [Tachyglossus aculeatus]
MAAVKSGWLWRRSSVLRRWKRNWFVLWLDGTLGYSQDETGQDEEGRVLIRFNCRSVKSGHDCPDLKPPEGLDRSCLLTVHLRDGPRLVLCAESKDDAVAWKTALLEASYSLVYNPYDDYYQPVALDAHHVTFVNTGHYGPYAGILPGATAPAFSKPGPEDKHIARTPLTTAVSLWTPWAWWRFLSRLRRYYKTSRHS